jgi:methionine-rich copper-binding protein CopC
MEPPMNRATKLPFAFPRLSNRKENRAARHGICATEQLESRLFLSGTVLASVDHGVLHIQDDSTANAVVLDQVGLTGTQLRITGSTGTLINNQTAPIILTGITGNVFVQTRGGENSLRVNSAIFPGNLTINSQGGADSVALNSVVVSATLDITNTASVSTNTTVDDSTIGRNLIVRPSSGGQSVVFNALTVSNNAVVTTGGGDDSLTIDDTTFHHTTRIDTGLGDDSVEIASNGFPSGAATTFSGKTLILLDAGNDNLQLGIAGEAEDKSVFLGRAYMNGGAGFDTLHDVAAATYTSSSPIGLAKFETNTPAARDIAPIVSSTSPANNATGIALNLALAVTFSKAMDPATFTASSVSVASASGAVVAGVVSYVGTTMTFTPDVALSANTTYTATITTGVKDAAGTPLAGNYSWTFTTGAAADTTPPTVSSIDPANHATSVALNKAIAVAFSEAMNPTTITSADVTVTSTGSIAVPGTVGYVGTTMTFTPTGNLAPATLYTVTISTGAKDLAGNALATAFTSVFTTGATADTTPPSVTSTTPANNATAVALNTAISASFSEAMNPSTVTAADVTITSPGPTPVTGTVSYVGTTMTFTPATALAPNTTFIGTIGIGAQDLAGNALVSPFTWTFTTGAAADTTPPTVASTTPANGVTAVALNTAISASFSEAMNPTTLTAADVTVTSPGPTAVAGNVTYSGTTMTFTPTAVLSASTVYTVTITTAATDLAGNHLQANYAWSFTTGVAPDVTPPTVSSINPVNGKTNFFINNVVTATFDEAMASATITTAYFTLSGPGNTPVAGTVTYNAPSDTATFTPTSNLASSTTFTATIVGGVNGVTDLAGNALVTNKVWTFTTGTQVAQAPVNLASAGMFAVMATASVTGSGSTVINGDVGLSPGSSQGIPPSDINGSIYVDDNTITTAQSDLLNAYNDAVGRSATAVALPGNLGGLTFTPGLYTNSSSVLIQGAGASNDVTLNAQGDPNAIFIFQMGSTLTTGPGAQIILTGGANASNIFWQVGTSATLDTTTVFQGNILAATSITVNNGSVVTGRLLAGVNSSGSVTVASSTVSLPS